MAPGVECLIGAAAAGERDAKAVVGSDECVVDGQRLAERRFGCGKIARAQVECGDVLVGEGACGIKGQRLFERAPGVCRATLLGVGDAEGVVGIRVVGWQGLE